MRHEAPGCDVLKAPGDALGHGQFLLDAGLDRLGRAKEVAQIAAVIGREFSHELLAAVTPLPEPELRAALARLVETELVFRRGEPLTLMPNVFLK